MKILIAEDDRQIGRAVMDGLEGAGFFPTIIRNGSKVIPQLSEDTYSVLLLDIMLPEVNGFEICRQARQDGLDIPILMLTARDSVTDKVRGLEAGADDYLAKPFEFIELLARIKALVRRSSVPLAHIIEVEDLVIHTTEKTVTRGGKLIQLTPREFKILQTLAIHQGTVLSKDEIAEKVWFDGFTAGNTIEVHIKNIRRKVDGEFQQKLIRTVYGSGYALRTDE